MAKIPFIEKISTLCLKSGLLRDFKFVSELYSEGKFDKAYRVFRDIIENESQWLKVADVYIEWADLELLANNNPCKALELLDKAKELGCSQMAYYYMKRAEALWLTGKHQEALQCYESSVAAEPCAFYRSMLARALSHLEDNRALSVWQEVLDEEPKNSLAHTYIGFELVKSGDRDKALQMAKKAEKLASSARDNLEVAQLYYELREFQTVINISLETMKLSKNREQVYDRGQLCAGIANCYLSMGQISRARKYLKRALRYNPKDEYVKKMQQAYEEGQALGT